MVNLLKVAALLLAFASAAFAQGTGELITIRVEGAPALAARVSVDLTSSLRNLDMRHDADGAWTATFAALPNMTSGFFQPKVSFLSAGGEVLPEIPGEKGSTVELASSELTSDSMSSGDLDKDAVFVFDDLVDPASIAVLTTKASLRPTLGKNTFVLPQGMDATQVHAIEAVAKDGRHVAFGPKWPDPDASEDIEIQVP